MFNHSSQTYSLKHPPWSKSEKKYFYYCYKDCWQQLLLLSRWIYPKFCFVKDKVTKRVVLHGVLKDGLYRLNLSFHNIKQVHKPQQLQVQKTTTNNQVHLNSNNRVRSSFIQFHLNSSDRIMSSFNVSSFPSSNVLFDVWHKRLEHLSDKVLA